MKRLNESGRTLVEMLGVLAIIGILSVVGLVGYRLATNKMWANTLIHEAQKRAVVVAGQIGFGQPVDLANFTENTFNGTTYDTKIYTPSGALWTNVNPQFALKLSDVQTDVCAEMKKISTRTQVIQSITDDCELIVYNNDLSEAKCEENAVNGSCQKCMMGVWTNICTTEHRCVNNVCVDAPEGYTQVEYLESTGTQYIDTGVKVKSSLKCKLEAKYSGRGSTIIRAYDNSNAFGLVFGSGQTNVQFFWRPRSVSKTNMSVDIPFDSWATIEIESNKLTVNETSSSWSDVTSPSFSTHLTLFGGFVDDTYTGSSIPVKYVQIWDGTTLVRDFIPVLDNDDVPCLYDKVSGQCFYNAGTGDFIAGPEIAPLLKD